MSMRAEGTMVGLIMMAISSRGPMPSPVRKAKPSSMPIRVVLNRENYHKKNRRMWILFLATMRNEHFFCHKTVLKKLTFLMKTC